MRRLVCAAMTVAVAVSGAATLTAGPGGTGTKTTVTRYPVQIEMIYREGDRVLQDGKNEYVNGKMGVSAVIEVTATTADGVTTYGSKLVFTASAYKGSPARGFHIDVSAPAITSCSPETTPPTTLAITPESPKATYVQVLGIGTMPVWTSTGISYAAAGGFFTPVTVDGVSDPGAVFRFKGSALLNYPDNCSNRYSVTRMGPGEWWITTDIRAGDTYIDPAGKITAVSSELGDVAGFESNNGGTFYGNFRLPFMMKVTCLSTCPPALPAM